MRVMLSAVALLTFSPCVLANDSADYARMGANAWKAFECAALAGELKDSEEKQRLFSFGYEQGMKFLDAVRSDQVTQRDVFTTVPSEFMNHAEGPNSDFILGRVFEVAGRFALGVTAQGTFDEQRSVAFRKYSDDNCQAIGRER